MKRVWLVRLGRHGEFEDAAIRENRLTLGFGSEQADLAGAKDRDALLKIMARLHPDTKPKAQANYAAQINQFMNIAEVGDLVVTPFKNTSTISIGRFTGPYERDANGRASRRVEWLQQDIPRDAFHQDLLHSFGAFMTVCEIARNNALARIEAAANTRNDPGDGAMPVPAFGGTDKTGRTAANVATEASDAPVDLDRVARDQVERRIASVFTGHKLTELIAAILRVQGYVARVSPPGADRGVDIVAGSGTLGLEGPRITVQVKSGNEIVDQPDLQALIGSVQDTHADHGLIVSWAGFTPPVRRRLNELYFRVRLWGRDDIIENLFATYERLPEDIRAELPLQRTWTLVLDGIE